MAYRKGLLVAAITALLSTQAVAQEVRDLTSAQRARVDQQIVLVRDAFDEKLNDYPTARFRDVTARIDPESTRIVPMFCGYVNAKNRMGAYGGWERFVVTGTTIKFESDGATEIILCDRTTRTIDSRDYSQAFTHR